LENQTELIVNAKPVQIPISKLKLDQTNPRFNHLSKKLTLSEIEKIIREDDETNVLAEQILAAGVVTESLLINSDYVVIEGNQRLVALRSLLKQVQEGQLDKSLKEKFQKVSCKIIPDEVNNETMDLHLARIHVKGKRQWKKFNRASHIYRLNRIHGISYDRLADTLGMGKATIQRCVIVYKTILGYSRKYPDDIKWFHKFTYFDFLFQRRDLKEIREDKDFVNDFIRWVHDGKFHDVRDIYQLAKVVVDIDAFQTLKKKNFKEALDVLEKKDPSLTSQEFKKISETIDVLKSPEMKPEEIITNPAKMKLLIKLESEARSLMADIDALRQRGILAN